MHFEPGTTLSHYKILSEIGNGGMGEVYLALDTRLDRKVALKVLPEECAKDSERMGRFVREAKSASALNHPNIITIYEIAEYEGKHLIAMEFVDGKTLTDYSNSKNLRYSSALDIAIRIASALEEAHSAGIIHRDIKPDNIMVRPNGHVKILDFGIAKLTVGPGDAETRGHGETDTPNASEDDETLIAASPHLSVPASPKTAPGMIIGTANYMSPEQAKGKEIDARSDIFSFGVVFYEMISGRLPFSGDSPLEIISSILKDEPKSLKGSDVPAEFIKVVIKCLRKNPDERYDDMSLLLSHLREIKKELEFQDKLEKTIQPRRDLPETQLLKAETADEPEGAKITEQSDKAETIQKSSISKASMAVVAVVGLAAIGLGYWFYNSESNQIESIAVMPFVNESGNEDVEYLSDGMTETLIGSLSKLPNLQVKPRSSVFRYKGKETDTKTIGQELNVQAILNGRVVQRGEQLTLSLELIDVQKDAVLWSDRYIRKQSELVSLQSEIAKDVSTKLKSKLSGEDEAKVTNFATTNPEAYQAYLKGRYYWNKRFGDNLKLAIEQFKVAVDKDPNYALAYVGLGDCYALLNEYTGASLSESSAQAKTYAERATNLDPKLGEPHATLGQVNGKLWKWKEAEQEYKRAIELSPNYATAYHWYFTLLNSLGRFDEAALMIKRAQELDPLSSVIGANVSIMYQLQNDHDASIENSRKFIELEPNAPYAYGFLGRSLLAKGRNTEAITNLEKGVELSNRDDYLLADLGYVYGVTGKRTEAIAIAKELEDMYAKKKTTGVYVASVYVGLGEKDKAFEWLEKDFESRSDLTKMVLKFGYEPLYDDPRYKDLLKRTGLSE
jgi:serine/threonine-protein kinase